MPIVPRLNDKLATNPWPDNKILSDKDIIKLSTKKEITLHLLDNNDNVVSFLKFKTN